MIEMPYFPFFREWNKVFKRLSYEDAGKLLIAIITYTETGNEPELDETLSLLFCLIHDSVDRAADNYAIKCEQNRRNGQKGGRPSRSDGNGNRTVIEKPNGYSDITENPTELNVTKPNVTKPNSTKPNTNTTKRNLTEYAAADGDTERARLTGDFETFWNAYPKRRGKSDALSEWINAGITSERLPVILEALRTQSASDDWNKEAGRFIPMPANYIHGKRWEDKPENDVKKPLDYSDHERYANMSTEM